MNKSEEVPGRLLVPGRDPPVLLEQVDKPLDLLAILVQMFVIIARHLPVLLRRDHRLGTLPLRGRHDRIAVVRLVPEERPRLVPFHQRLGLGHVGFLAPRQEELDRVAQGVHEDMDLGAEAAPRTAQCLIVVYPPFFRPRPHAGAPGPRCCRGSSTPGRDPGGSRRPAPTPPSWPTGRTVSRPSPTGRTARADRAMGPRSWRSKGRR